MNSHYSFEGYTTPGILVHNILICTLFGSFNYSLLCEQRISERRIFCALQRRVTSESAMRKPQQRD